MKHLRHHQGSTPGPGIQDHLGMNPMLALLGFSDLSFDSSFAFVLGPPSSAEVMKLKLPVKSHQRPTIQQVQNSVYIHIIYRYMCQKAGAIQGTVYVLDAKRAALDSFIFLGFLRGTLSQWWRFSSNAYMFHRGSES